MKINEDVKKMRMIAEEACTLVKKFGGSFSGEHGDGIVRSEFIEKMFDKISDDYDFLNWIITFNNHKRWKNNILSIAKKLTNGLIRIGHDVINISDRDVVRLNRGLRNFNKGSDYLDNLLLETIDNYKPDAMVLGHVNNIQEKTLEFAKNKYKNLKIKY